MNYINDLEIPDSIIEKCERLREETGETHFVFRHKDLEPFGYVTENKVDGRDVAISKILGDKEEIFIVTNKFASESIFSYYDTETKVLGRYIRYKIITNFIDKLGFTSWVSNLGLEYEQSFVYTFDNNTNVINIRVSPNMFISIKTFSQDGYPVRDNGFFSKSLILNFIQRNLPNEYKNISRDMILDEILD